MASGPHPPLLGSYLTELDIHETVTAGDGTLWNLLLGICNVIPWALLPLS